MGVPSQTASAPQGKGQASTNSATSGIPVFGQQRSQIIGMMKGAQDGNGMVSKYNSQFEPATTVTQTQQAQQSQPTTAPQFSGPNVPGFANPYPQTVTQFQPPQWDNASIGNSQPKPFGSGKGSGNSQPGATGKGKGV